jgi:hypothetical protein
MTSNKYSLVHMMLGSRYYAIIEIKNGFKLTKPFVNCLDLASLLLYDTFPYFLRPPPPRVICNIDGLFSCIADHHLFLEGFDLVFDQVLFRLNFVSLNSYLG